MGVPRLSIRETNLWPTRSEVVGARGLEQGDLHVTDPAPAGGGLGLGVTSLGPSKQGDQLVTDPARAGACPPAYGRACWARHPGGSSQRASTPRVAVAAAWGPESQVTLQRQGLYFEDG